MMRPSYEEAKDLYIDLNRQEHEALSERWNQLDQDQRVQYTTWQARVNNRAIDIHNAYQIPKKPTPVPLKWHNDHRSEYKQLYGQQYQPILNEAYRNLQPDEKEPYQRQYEAKLATYDEAIRTWKEKYPWRVEEIEKQKEEKDNKKRLERNMTRRKNHQQIQQLEDSDESDNEVLRDNNPMRR